MLLTCDRISKVYEGGTVVANVTFSVEAGQMVALVGASGCGKSTLLSIAGLMLSPTAGHVELDGRRTDELDDRSLSRLRAESFGFVFQHNQLLGSLRALDNVLVPSCFAYQGDCQQRAMELMESFGLGDRLYHYPHQLSVGQKRRVALARALLLSPSMLIADEPTNDLDPATARTVMDVISSFPDEGHAVLLATHDMAVARQADRILWIHDGGVEPVGADDLDRVFSAAEEVIA